MPVAGIKQLVIRPAPKELDTTGEEMDVVEHLRFLMGEIINAYLTANGLDVREIADQRETFNLIMTNSQFPYLDVNTGRLGEESYISLIVTMIFEEVDLFIGHFHFTVIEVYTSFINDDEAVLHEVFTYIVFGDLKSTTDRKVTVHSTPAVRAFFASFAA